MHDANFINLRFQINTKTDRLQGVLERRRQRKVYLAYRQETEKEIRLMKKIAVVYWSGTGNTEMMANSVAEGIKEAGAEASVMEPENFSADQIDQFDAIAFGCPAMGAEELEETEFAPMFENCKEKLQGKKIALFGSYGWGDGEWMRTWEEDCKEKGAELVCDSVICTEEPDDEAKEACKSLGKSLVS